jgi:hypothetical protein
VSPACASPNPIQRTCDPAVGGISGDVQTSIWDSLAGLPTLERGQNFVWQRTYLARSAGNAWRSVRVERFNQTAGAPLPDEKGSNQLK